MNINQRSSDCSQEWAGSSSPMPGKGSAVSGCRRSIRTPTRSRRTGSEACPISETSGRRISPSGFARRAASLMCLRAGCHASLQVCSESGWVPPMSDGFGLERSRSAADYDPGSHTLRTRQGSLALTGDGLGTELCVDFPRSGMTCGGMLFPLQSLVRAIAGSDFSSSLPTPIAADGSGSEYCYGPKPLPGEERRKIRKLPGAIKAALLPPPAAADGEKGGRGDLLAIVQGRPNRHCSWAVPTPTAADGLRGPDYAKAARPGSGGDDLTTFVSRELLPTPTARDFKDTAGMARTSAKGRKRDDTLPRRIYGGGSTAVGGGWKQTPEFRCWLMGFPVDWLKPLAGLPGMQSCRKRSRPSRGGSGK